MHNNLGKEITNLRKTLHLTQEQLSNEICTQPTISMIERGEIIPGLDLLIAISLKLKKPITYFTDILLTDNYNYINKLVYDIEELTIKQQFNIVNEIVNRELDKDPQDSWFRIFLKWQFYLSSYHLNKVSLDDALFKIKELVSNTPDTIINKSFLKDRIYNTIAFLYAIRGDYNDSLFYYNKIDLNSNEFYSPRLNQDIYQLRILYNKTKTLYDMNKYEEAIQSCEQGIVKSIKLENMSIIGNFYYYLGQCYEKKNVDKENIANCYTKALFFFELLNRDIYTKILKMEKKNFLKSNLGSCDY
ncbi:helix-turn-helix domain-containing protein [Lysinibacillus sp. NPDC097231]|uniref:helix-turn-helix domain-containing protein n=1 Tax=Lysinibacillus sp. NPDC097231 TaxID=3364142 RepID=UPI0038020CB8